MKFKKDKNSTTKIYSLHDSRIQQIDFNKNIITLKLDRITSYPQGKQVCHRANIILDNIHIYDCEVYVLNKIPNGYNKQKFSGECLTLEDFAEKYNPLEFEIIDELHDGRAKSYLNKKYTY
ncbi:hypothetical protein QJU96_08020 [Pasteurella skyensis]|uniref:Uncharacterized protein n=1 Tax=Phocoenobacter skyensis TaxID=97481 RepID=A0AAJ6P2G7_9PAST|nr:hypothetical protein [Pasteurella skyensis]MDP8171230.1 hypothetical protein [Pasteurella skyensis]MDP8174678.1 hypothetical protein [Pasteurella skyensis]